MPLPTDPREWVKKVRAKTPVLLEVGKPAPKAVLSFGGCGFLVTYSLGVALYLQQEKADLLAQSFLLGAGAGVIPAVALACGARAVNIEKVRDAILDNRFMVTDEERRIEVLTKFINLLLPRNAVELVSGRLALTIGFSNRDPGYMKQTKEQIHFGHHVAQWTDVSDLAQCILASMAPNTAKPMIFRDADNVMRGTMMSLSSELDQYCRHIYIHGYCGYPYNKHQTRHNIYFGRHGFLANTYFPFWKQALLAFAPTFGGAARREELLEAYDAGYNDARRYERWEEDPYHFSKADRSPSDDFSFRQLRANLFGGKKAAERFEL
ncbi:uncharacterized protein TEOVI_000780200 [Trypanosoma equiperdum]|uniref:PNPLA domain-containing protein n=2 Tax=Trypanozoon TaxID=39700 RepID=Q386C0_TRYB2|nr:hypothetical protein, conserved [Trypanosoma brucei brucei TREU927]EAN79361.1 hypothetical protein, conserved [Trypanosoma brucei brucei TREU927]SCU66624.1 hypothetical protein, conserved [Trypanosoma equiperdum]